MNKIHAKSKYRKALKAFWKIKPGKAEDKPKLLFISRLMPSPTGGGSFMRAYYTLQALSTYYDIDLLVFTMSYRNPPAPPNPAVKKMCSRIVINVSNPVYDYRYLLARLWDKSCKRLFPHSSKGRDMEICPNLSPQRKKKLQSYFNGRHFETVHIFRLANFPVYKTISDNFSSGHVQLDLDDFESDKLLQISKLLLEGNNTEQAELIGRFAASYEQMEQSVLPILDQVFVCSALDKDKVAAQYKCRQLTVLPNVYPVPKEKEHIAEDGKFRLLFVGSLGYTPNADALFYFCDQILPLLRKTAPSKFELRIIGDMNLVPKQIQKTLAQQPEIVILGRVDDVAPYYWETDCAIIPLRAGGGTRIKALESFAWQVPVVSTSKGIEGLGVKHEHSAMIADTPQEFADQCARLMADSSLRENLKKNAKLLVESEYAPERLTEILLTPVLGVGPK